MSAERGATGRPPRRATLADLDEIARLWTALTLHHATLDAHYALPPDAGSAVRDLLRAMLRDPDVLALLDVGDDAMATGLCIARFDAAPPIHDERARVEISDLWVEPACRRRGRGRALAMQALVWARERGVRRIEVRVSAHNADARAFWRGLGFGPFMDVLDLRL